MKNILILTLVCLSIMACRKDLDLTSDRCFDVKQFLQSKQATRAVCGTEATFEGDKICLNGLIDMTIDEATGLPHHIALLGGKNYDQSINLIVDDAILPEVFSQLNRKRGITTYVTATIKGFDQHRQFKCTRGFELHIHNVSEITFD
jgi:hypothetical protein